MDNYYGDPRVVAKETNKWYQSINDSTMKAVVLVEDDEGNETEKQVAFAFELCPTCDGRGTHVNPSIDCNGLTQDDFDADPDFRDSYFNRDYDVQCYDCNGQRVVPVCKDEQHLEELRKQAEFDAEYRAIEAAERRMGC